MGGRSSSSSNSSNDTSTDNSNSQINDTEGLVLNFEGSENNEATIIQSDQDAIAESFNFGESALDSVTDVVNNSLNTVDFATQAAFDLGGDSLDEAFNFGESAINQTQDFATDVLQESQETTRNALQVAANAQTGAFSRIRDIADSFTGSSNNTFQLLIAVVAGIGATLIFAVLRSR